MSATVFDAAAYILTKTKEMTTMKLQKLLYYSQAWSLVWDEKPIFDEDFEAWANGPVCKKIYDVHQGCFHIKEGFFDIHGGSVSNLNSNAIETIDIVLRDYGDYTPIQLSYLTHKEAPWRKAREGYGPGEWCDEIITKESMQQYYGGLSTN